MLLKCNHRIKDGKEHRYWSIVESRRCAHGRVVQRQVLYLGEINDSQREAWIRCNDVFDAEAHPQVKLALLPVDRPLPVGMARRRPCPTGAVQPASCAPVWRAALQRLVACR